MNVHELREEQPNANPFAALERVEAAPDTSVPAEPTVALHFSKSTELAFEKAAQVCARGGGPPKQGQGEGEEAIACPTRPALRRRQGAPRD